MTSKTKSATRPFQLKALGEDGAFAGYGSVFDVVDSYRDVILRGAFADTLAEHRERGSMPALLWQHQADEPIGVYSEMREDKVGLYVEGQLLTRQNVPTADRAYSLLKAGAVGGLSIGFNVPEGGETFNEDRDVYELSAVELWETSIVTFPANREAQITEVRADFEARRATLREAIDKFSRKEFEQFLRDVGCSRRQAKAVIAAGYAGLSQRDAAESTEDEAIETIVAARRIIDKLNEVLSHDGKA